MCKCYILPLCHPLQQLGRLQLRLHYHCTAGLFSHVTILFCMVCVVLQAASEYIPEKVKKAEKKLEENPYDLDAWSILIREAQV